MAYISIWEEADVFLFRRDPFLALLYLRPYIVIHVACRKHAALDVKYAVDVIGEQLL